MTTAALRSPTLLVINADDLGFAPGVNRGIAEAHEAGTVSSASMMVNTPAFLEAAQLVRDRLPALGVGLHLNVVSGRPLSEVPTLTDARTGRFHSLAELARRAMGGRVSAADVRRETDAQLAALRRAGIVPTHLDSHRHAHALPGLLPAIIAGALADGVPIVRRPLDAPSPGDPLSSGKMLVLHAAWRVAERGLDAAGRALVSHSPHFRGIALQGYRGAMPERNDALTMSSRSRAAEAGLPHSHAPDLEARLLGLLDHLPPGATELMLHPGHDDAVLAAQDSYRDEREREVAALTSGAVRARLERGDIRLVSFRELRTGV